MPFMPSTDAPRRVPDGPTRVTRALALALLATLVVLCVGWEWAWAPTGRGTLALKALPLLFAFPGLLRWRLYTYRWLSLLVWLYVAEGLVRAGGERPAGAVLAGMEVALSIALFAACVAHIRWRLRKAVPGEAALS